MRRALVSDSKAVAIMRSSSFNINQDWLSLLQDTLHDPSAGLGISYSLGLGESGLRRSTFIATTISITHTRMGIKKYLQRLLHVRRRSDEPGVDLDCT